ncbi:MAG: hypothetical protein ABFD54_08695 [Armatimonadota bacterium]|nr:hypothetical protein [bacterium]
MVQIVNVADYSTLYEFRYGKSSAAVVAFHPKHRIIAIGDDMGEVKICSVPDGRVIHVARVCSKQVESIVFFHSGRLLAAGSSDGVVRLLTSSTKPIRNLKSNCGGALSLAVSPDDNVVAVGYETGKIISWSTKTGKPIKSWKAHIGPVTSMAYSDDGSLLASSGDQTGDKAKLWDSANWSLVSQLCEASSVGFTANGKVFVTGGRSSGVRIWSKHGKILAQCDLPAVTVLPVSKQLVASTYGGMTTLHEVPKCSRGRAYSGNGAIVRHTSISSDGKLIALSRERRLIIR